MPLILLVENGISHTLEAAPGTSLSTAIWLSGIVPPQPLCNGLATCGRCRVRFLSDAPEPCEAEKHFFRTKDLERGWRLACRHRVPAEGWLRIEVPSQSPGVWANSAASLAQELFVGIDLGTTSIQWEAVDSGGCAAASGGMWNPQGGAGADIISRLAFAQSPSGLQILSRLAGQAIAAIIENLQKQGSISRICIAANSAMTEILLNLDITGLCAAPYHLAFSGGGTRPIPGNDLPQVIFPPLPGPFVGGDISAGLLAIIEKKPPLPFLLMDFGTNGEIALLDRDKNLFLASLPLGPALEGTGPFCGQPVSAGITTAWRLSPSGIVPVHGCGDGPARGISATGYISLLAILHRLAILKPDGQFAEGRLPLARKITESLTAERLPLPENLCLTPGDVELLLKVKAALQATLQAILQRAGITPGEVAAVFLAGALGEHLEIDDLLTLGFLPAVFSRKISSVGNSALAGACVLACQPEKMDGLRLLCEKAEIINLADDPDFMKSYINFMYWGENPIPC